LFSASWPVTSSPSITKATAEKFNPTVGLEKISPPVARNADGWTPLFFLGRKIQGEVKAVGFFGLSENFITAART
jgi:hypothetical protein